MDKSTQTMIDNLAKNTGRTLEQWIAIIAAGSFVKHGEIVKNLKEQHGLTHGFANLIALKAKGSDAGSAKDEGELITQQYAGKEHLKPFLDKLLAVLHSFGPDVTIAPKKAYVSIRRSKQFAMLQPATKTRFEIGINLKSVEAKGRLVSVDAANAMCSHKINITHINDIDSEVIDWLRKAYEKA